MFSAVAFIATAERRVMYYKSSVGKVLPEMTQRIE